MQASNSDVLCHKIIMTCELKGLTICDLVLFPEVHGVYQMAHGVHGGIILIHT